MTQDSLGRNLRMLRADRGITLAEAEELTGVTQETLSALERGQRGAYTSTLRKIADAYDITLGDLLDDAVEVRHISDAEKDPVYGSWVTFARRFSERWQRKIAEGTFDRGEYNEFIANLEDFDPILVELGLREKQERPYNPHATFGPVVEFAITRITALFNPMIRAATEKFEEDELAPLRRARAELERLESGTRRVANG